MNITYIDLENLGIDFEEENILKESFEKNFPNKNWNNFILINYYDNTEVMLKNNYTFIEMTTNDVYNYNNGIWEIKREKKVMKNLIFSK